MQRLVSDISLAKPYHSALLYASGEDLTLAGFSFGSRTGMAVGMDDDRVKRLITIGTPVDKYGDYEFLLGVRKPILFVHGDRDEFGAIENLTELFEQVKMVTDAELVTLKGAGHFFDDHLDELREAVREWTERHLDRADGD